MLSRQEQQQQSQHRYKRNHHRRNETRTMLIGWSFLFTLFVSLCRTTDAFSTSSSSPGVTIRKTTAQHSRSQPRRNNIMITKERQRISSSSSSLHSVTPALAVAGAVSGAISGGLFAGGLHAVAGPDHLAALLPRCCGQSWWKAGTVGAIWGLGHGVSAVAIGTVAFFAKQRSSAAKSLLAINSVTELAVGASLIVIGLLGIKEAREWAEDTAEELDGNSIQQLTSNKSLSAAVVVTTSMSTQTTSQHQQQHLLPPPVRRSAIFLNGLLHGFSWDGAPSLAPALAVATWNANLAFLGAYATGTMITMAAVTCLIGEGTRRAGRLFPNIPRQISVGSSIVAIVIGLVWSYLGIKAL